MHRRTPAALLVAVLILTTFASSPADASNHNVPVGRLDYFNHVPGGIRVAGWVVDEDTSASVAVHAYVNGTLAMGFLANHPRADIGAKYPALGPNHGFDVVIPIGTSPATVCLFAINKPSGVNPRLGCASFDLSPVGHLDTVQRRPGENAFTVRVSGWAVDPGIAASVPIHLYANGSLVGSTLANSTRADIESRYPPYGSQRGFAATLQLPPGTHRVCAFGIDAGAGSNRLLGCKNITVGTLPVGVVDSIRRTGGTNVTVAGWTVDPDTSAPIDIEVRVGGVLRGTTTASILRSTIGSYDRYYGKAHGYSTTAPLGTSSSVQVCVYALNAFQGSGSRLLGCKVV